MVRAMKGERKRLAVVAPDAEHLGAETIMDRTLATVHGIPYVHLAAFAIDADRVRATLEDDAGDDALPFGWEIFLTAHYVRTRFDAAREEQRLIIEDAVVAILDAKVGREPPLGSQLAFAVFDLARRDLLPSEMLMLFDVWKKKPDKVLDALEVLWDEPEAHAGELAHACIQVEISPAPAPPTFEAWGAMVLAGRL